MLCFLSAASCGSSGAVANQHLSTSPPPYRIEGSIAPPPSGAGATVVLSGQSSATTMADGSGNYSFVGLANGSYTISPSKSGYTFSPASLTASISGANVSGENFTATANASQGYSISGSVSVNGAGATLTLSGGSTATVAADGSGNYSFSGLANGTYKMTPSKTGYIFTPATQSVVVNGANATAINFTAAAGSQTVLFYDDFTSGTLSADWTILNRPGDSSNNELECYTPNNVAIVGGVLQLTAQVDSSCQGYNYTSGTVQWTSFNYTYGTIEIRAKMAGGQGTWPALWFLGHNCQTTNITSADNVPPCNWPALGSDEIDLVEIMKGSVTYYNPQVHSAGNSPECLIGPLADVSQNWHVYKTTWSAGQLVFNVDGGAQTCTISSNVPTTPMFLIMNVAVGGFGGGTVNNSTLPQTMSIDYVKVTQ